MITGSVDDSDAFDKKVFAFDMEHGKCPVSWREIFSMARYNLRELVSLLLSYECLYVCVSTIYSIQRYLYTQLYRCSLAGITTNIHNYIYVIYMVMCIIHSECRYVVYVTTCMLSTWSQVCYLCDNRFAIDMITYMLSMWSYKCTYMFFICITTDMISRWLHVCYLYDHRYAIYIIPCMLSMYMTTGMQSMYMITCVLSITLQVFYL